jgi:hypothetical protein
MPGQLLRRPLREAGPGVIRLVLGLTFAPRQRAVVLEALGAPGAADLAPGAGLAALLDRAFLCDGGVELIEHVVRGQLSAPLAALAPLSWAGAAEAFQAHGDDPRRAAALLLTVATRAGWLWRKLEQRVVQELEARAIDAIRLRPAVAWHGAFIAGEVRP